MATPPESPVEEVVYELETTRVPKPIPVALEDLCRQTKFTRQEIRVMYRGFKTVRSCCAFCFVCVSDAQKLNSKSIDIFFRIRSFFLVIYKSSPILRSVGR